VAAPFDGVITQRNVDVGTLVQGNATSGTFIFEIMQEDVIRVRVYVPQDAAFGVAPGIDAMVRVPEIPDREFRRKSPSASVPAEAIIFNRDGMQVAVVNNGGAEFRKVNVKRDLGTRVEVDTGVKAGDQVILNPPVNLFDGSKVQARQH
jgi:multidrug efflux pump subunit AcrA (membrane-fusion protein)